MACSRMPKCMLRPAQFSGSKFPAPSMFVWVLGARSAEPPIISGRRGPRTAIVFPEAMRVAIGPSAGGECREVGVPTLRKLPVHDPLEFRGQVRVFLRISLKT